MKKSFVAGIILSALTLGFSAHANEPVNVDVLVPSRPGGSMHTILSHIVPAAAAKGVNLVPKYLGTCEKVNEVLASSAKNGEKVAYAWFNDLSCPVPAEPTAQNLVGIVAQTPVYLCGRKPALTQYKNVDNLKMAVMVGADNMSRAEELKTGLGFNTMRLISYANSGAVKTALVTNEVDLVYSAIGPVLAKENGAVCYAVSARAPEPNMVTVTSLNGGKPQSNIMYLSSLNLPAATFSKVQSVVQAEIKTAEYKDLVVNKMARQLPPTTVDEQLKSLK